MNQNKSARKKERELLIAAAKWRANYIRRRNKYDEKKMRETNHILANFAEEVLLNDNAEPITPEWLEGQSKGWEVATYDDGCWWKVGGSHDLYITNYDDDPNWFYINDAQICEIKTRGQLRSLIIGLGVIDSD